MQEIKREEDTDEVGPNHVINPPPKRALQLTNVQNDTLEDSHPSYAKIAPPYIEFVQLKNVLDVTFSNEPESMYIAPPCADEELHSWNEHPPTVRDFEETEK